MNFRFKWLEWPSTMSKRRALPPAVFPFVLWSKTFVSHDILVPRLSSLFSTHRNRQAQTTSQSLQAIHLGGLQTLLDRLGRAGSLFHPHKYLTSKEGYKLPVSILVSTEDFICLVDTIRFIERQMPIRNPFSSKLYIFCGRMLYVSTLSANFR
jgi:hypothetical protein